MLPFEFFEFTTLQFNLAPLLLKLKLLYILFFVLTLHFVTDGCAGDASQYSPDGSPGSRTPNRGPDNCASCSPETRASQRAFLSG